jgi:type I restriction enzyme, S subunit
MNTIVPLRRIARLIYGDALSSGIREEGNIPVVGSGGVSGLHTSANVSGPAIVVGRKGSYGAIHWVDQNCFVIDTAYSVQPVNSETDMRWLYYALQAVDFKGPSQDVGVPGLSREAAYAVHIPLSSLDEQRRIADFLDAETARIDKLLAATDQQIELLDSRRLEALRIMTTGTSKNVRRANTNVYWMPHVCSEWSLLKVGTSFKTGSGTTPRSSDLKFFDGPHSWINTGDLRDGPVCKSAKSVSDVALQEYPTLRIYTPGALMVAMYGATIGRVGINKMPACVNQACCVLTPLGPVDVMYAFYWFIAHRTEIVRLGSGGGQPNISQDLVRSLRISAPKSVAEQRSIASDCHRLDKEIANYRSYLSRRSALLSERRQALITAAVTGGISG